MKFYHKAGWDNVVFRLITNKRIRITKQEVYSEEQLGEIEMKKVGGIKWCGETR